MSSGRGRIWWEEGRWDSAPDGWRPASTSSFRNIEDRVTGPDRMPLPPADWAEDLFRVARAVFLADKYVCRDDFADRWTRRIQLCVPVAHRDRWEQSAASQHLSALLRALSGDEWEVDFRDLVPASSRLALPGSEYASDVALFSGGLDSLSWAAKLASSEERQPMLLVMFRESKLYAEQNQAVATVRRIARENCGRRVLVLPITQQVRTRALERSTRTRGLLYAAAAIRTASGNRVSQVQIPENGQLAVNPPLTAARSGACSTRSVHPWTLHHLNALVTAISAQHDAVTVVNPLASKTKGEVCQAALRAGARGGELDATLSCGRPPKRLSKSGFPNCGVCFPCLVRRSGLLHAKDADGTPYESVPWDTTLPDRRRRDWADLQHWLGLPFDLTDLLADAPLPSTTDIPSLLDVIIRGRTELRRLVPCSGTA